MNLVTVIYLQSFLAVFLFIVVILVAIENRKLKKKLKAQQTKFAEYLSVLDKQNQKLKESKSTAFSK